MKFKVGDKVRIKREYAYVAPSLKGKICTVSDVSQPIFMKVKLLQFKEIDNFWSSTFFKKV